MKPINKHSKLKLSLFLSSCALINSACNIESVTIPDSTPCHVQGLLQNGNTSCAHTNTTTDVVFSLDFAETLDLLQAQPARTCVPVNTSLQVCDSNPSPSSTPQDLPERGASVIFEVDQFSALMTSLQVACRDLGSHCSFQVVTFLKSQGFAPF